MENTEIEILLIEDNQSDAEMTIRALRKSNIANKIVHLEDGFEALEFIFGTGEYANRNISNLPKVILLDLKMPRMDGIEVLRKIKGEERTKKIPVVVLTSSKEDPDIQTCYDLGVNAYVVKPVEIKAFSKAISDLGLFWLVINQPPK
ncbi:MAG TPA: response regulator [Hanamia sp.]